MAASAATPVLECRGLKKAYAQGSAQIHVLQGVDIAVARGELVGKAIGIEQHQIGLHAGANKPTGFEAEMLGRKPGHLVDGFGQGEPAGLTHINTHHAAKCTITARVQPADTAIGTEVAVLPGQEIGDVGGRHRGADY